MLNALSVCAGALDYLKVCSAGDRGSALEEHGPIATEFLEEKHLGITWFILVQQSESTFFFWHNSGIIYSRNNQNYTKLFLFCASKVCRQNWTWKTMFEMWASFRELFLFCVNVAYGQLVAYIGTDWAMIELLKLTTVDGELTNGGQIAQTCLDLNNIFITQLNISWIRA